MITTISYRDDVSDFVKEVCIAYWDRKSANSSIFLHSRNALSIKFNLKPHEITKIAKQASILIVHDCRCLGCDEINTCKTRSDLFNLRLDHWYCNKCMDIKDKERNDMLYYTRLKNEILEVNLLPEKLAQLENYRDLQVKNIPAIEKLATVDKFLLVAIIDKLSSKDLNHTLPLNSHVKRKISPLSQMDVEVVQKLFLLNILLLNINDAISNATIDENNELAVDFRQSLFDIPYSCEDLDKLYLSIKHSVNTTTLLKDREYLNWCTRIQIAECICYLSTRAHLNGLMPPLDENIHILLQTCLARYSISEIYYIIWKAVENAASFAQKPNISKKKASESIYDNINMVFGKMSSGSWKGNRSYRDAHCPQSLLTKAFFDDVFKEWDCGFNHTLHHLVEKFDLTKNVNLTNHPTLTNNRIETNKSKYCKF